MTLHLRVRAKDGTYAGPIVVGREGKGAIVGVKAGARLGKARGPSATTTSTWCG